MDHRSDRPVAANAGIVSDDAGAAELSAAFESCRDYLLLAAEAELDRNLQGKAGASDLVQQTYLEAQRDFLQFRGTTREELVAWLLQILLHNAANFRRFYRGTAKRQIDRERSIHDPESVSLTYLARLQSHSTSPSGRAARIEEAAILAKMLHRLPEDYRRVLILRHWEEKTFSEIGSLMQRSPDAARMLWWRACDRLALELESVDAE